VLEVVFVLLEPSSPSRRIFIGSHSLPPSLVRRIGPSVYGFKPHTPMDLLSLPLQEQVNLDATKRSDFIKRLHTETRKNIEKKSAQYAKQAKVRRRLHFSQEILYGCIYARIAFPNNVRVSYLLEVMVRSRFSKR
jgi:hypothetical protein